MSVQAQKGNKILRISEDAIEKYLGMGYNIIGSDGAVLRKAVPSDNNQLKLEYTQNVKEIESLKAEVASLKDKVALLTQENKRLTKELEAKKEVKAVEEDAVVTEDKPAKTTRKRKQTTEEKAD